VYESRSRAFEAIDAFGQIERLRPLAKLRPTVRGYGYLSKTLFRDGLERQSHNAAHSYSL